MNACGRAVRRECSPFGDPPAELHQTFFAPYCGKGVRLGPWQDSDGTARYACLFEPPQASPSKPLPMVVWLHPSLLPVISVQWWTDLLKHLDDQNLSNDPQRPGFIVLAPAGRNTSHYYPWPDDRGMGWDNWYRQFSKTEVTVDGRSYKENVDAAAIDHFIDGEMATGKVDHDRVYISGWSNGAAMAYAYGLSRPNVAAIAVFSSPNPYHMAPDACPQTPVAVPRNNSELQIANLKIPAYQVHNNCDIVGLCPNSLLLEDQLRRAGISATDVIVNSKRDQVSACDASCGNDPAGEPARLYLRGVYNHARWPDKWTSAMLDFFRRHPLNSGRRAAQR
jgi:dienelactone hydrolase